MNCNAKPPYIISTDLVTMKPAFGSSLMDTVMSEYLFRLLKTSFRNFSGSGHFILYVHNMRMHAQLENGTQVRTILSK